MPFFDFDPIDPDLDLAGNLGPGRENRLEDRVKLASAIEKKTGAAPYADLGRFGDRLAARFTARPGARKDRAANRGDKALSPSFLGAIGAAQIKHGTDPDAIVLKDGPTRDALRSRDEQQSDNTFTPLPRLGQPVGPRRPNLPQDRRALQGKLASLGYVPRVSEQALFPHITAGQGGSTAADGLSTLLDGVRRFQQAEGLRRDGLVNPDGPTERALDTRNERARTAHLERLETLGREIMESDAPEYVAIADRPAADALAGLIVANEVQDQRKRRLAKNSKVIDTAENRGIPRRLKTLPTTSETTDDILLKTSLEKNYSKIEGGTSSKIFELSPVIEEFDPSHLKLLQQKDYWKNRQTVLQVLAEIRGEQNISGFVYDQLKFERKEALRELRKTEKKQKSSIVLISRAGRGRRQRRNVGEEISQRSIDLRVNALLRKIRKYDPGFWVYQLRSPDRPTNYSRKDISYFERTLSEYKASALRKIRMQQGMAWSSRKLPTTQAQKKWLRGSHGNAGSVPEHIAGKLRGRTFRNWGHFRREFWTAVASDKNLSRQFSAENLRRMRRGNAPEAHETQWNGKKTVYEIHHIRPVRDRVGQYDMGNMMILTPWIHRHILPRDIHYGTGRRK